ncbi:hypothetical protein AHAS_Ahas04G0133700 [Arachis hypogaea]
MEQRESRAGVASTSDSGGDETTVHCATAVRLLYPLAVQEEERMRTLVQEMKSAKRSVCYATLSFHVAD